MKLKRIDIASIYFYNFEGKIIDRDCSFFVFNGETLVLTLFDNKASLYVFNFHPFERLIIYNLTSIIESILKASIH